MKRKKRIRVGRRGGEKIQAAEWVDEELRDSIKKRSKLSREWRIARKRGEPEEVIKECERKYREQKILTGQLTGEKKGSWEIYKIQETKADGKKFWSLVKELLGRTKKKDEEVYIYEEDGGKKM